MQLMHLLKRRSIDEDTNYAITYVEDSSLAFVIFERTVKYF
jgi:hypothetical protein